MCYSGTCKYEIGGSGENVGDCIYHGNPPPDAYCRQELDFPDNTTAAAPRPEFTVEIVPVKKGRFRILELT